MNILEQAEGQNWSLYNADCVELCASLPDNSVDLSVYSPPFANLYIYSDSVADMGNCANDQEFFSHYQFLIREKFRVTVPGRVTCVHCMDLPTSKTMHGYIGRRDFSG